MSATAAISPACIATSTPGRTGPRKWTPRPPIVVIISRTAPHHDTRHHRRRARAQSAFPPPGCRRARHGREASWTAATSRSWRNRARRTWRNSCRNQVEIVASMPCYLLDNVDRQRGKGVFDGSIRALQRLNALGYGREGLGPHAQPRLQPARPVAAAAAGSTRGRLQARARRALRHRVQQAVHARQHADPAVRLDAGVQGRVRRLSGRCCAQRTATRTSTA